ncbi:organic cation transporter protein-like [Leguminivora glycinivorella]|uniref:organic cation transporter protein-like n=1 Tax=Leguminivora glycinivorella TaxID=1035111 RepID=UPI00200F1250|nr:organic cation transporter protein-like [Leguminivora glycinivorella]
MSEDKRSMNLDRILVEEVGQWGRFQLKAVVLCALVAIMGGLQCYVYLFTVVKVKTRCLIPECEAGDPVFSPPWLPHAVPPSGNSFDSCHRFPARTGNTSDSCPADWFITNESVRCEEYVYEHKNSAYYEFGLACDEWLPTLVGSVRTVGYMLCLPIMGLVTDRWGRRLALSLAAFYVACVGSSTYFAGSYMSYITLSFAEQLIGAWVFPCSYVLAVEYVGPKYRMFTGATISTSLAVGEILIGFMAWLQPYWRHLILILYMPEFIFITYIWIAPESVRWLISKGRYEEALTILEKAAKTNGKVLSEKTLKEFSDVKPIESKEKASEPWLICQIFKHKTILLRCLITPIWWLTSILMYYGLTIASVGISGDKYVNYTASVAVQVPGYWAAVLLMDRIGRKALVSTGFLISGACQIAFIFVPGGNYWLSLSVYLIGKMCIAGVTTSLYVYTAELYPTRYRTSLLAYSSMIGRVGGILAPLMPGLAAVVWEQLPFVVFGALALVSGMLVLLAPETLGAPLPDSMEEAADLGRRQ